MAVSVPTTFSSIDTHHADRVQAFVISDNLYIDGGEEHLIQNDVQTAEQICEIPLYRVLLVTLLVTTYVNCKLHSSHCPVIIVFYNP